MAAPNAAMTALSHPFSSEQLLERTLSSLNEEKAEDVIAINLRGKSEVADNMIVCSGRSSRQVTSIAEKLASTLKQDFGILCKIEGKVQGDWVLIDAGDVVIHVFRPEVREFYQLEKMWMDPGLDGTSQAGASVTLDASTE
jgi:ribosome-associated protein